MFEFTFINRECSPGSHGLLVSASKGYEETNL